MVNSICNWTRTQMSAYVDGELRDDVARRVGTHLEQCSNCRARHHEESELVTSAIHALVAAEPPGDFAHRIEQALRTPTPVEAQTVPASGEPSMFGGGRRMFWAYAAAAVLLVSLFWIPGQFELPQEPVTVVTTDRSDPIVAMTAPPVDAEESALQLRRGDFDGDGNFTIADLALLRQYLQDSDSVLVEICAPAIDFDHDGELTPTDLHSATRDLYALISGNREDLFLAYDPSTATLMCATNDCF